MITLQQGTIYMGTAAPSSGGGGSTTAISVENKNTTVGATNPLNFWEGTSAEYASGGGSQTWYNWQSGGRIDINSSTLPSDTYTRNIAYGNGKFMTDSRFSGSKSYVLISNNNGVSWTKQSFDLSSQYKYGLTTGGIAYGNNTWVVCFYNNSDKYIAYSLDDGVNWTLGTLPSSISGTNMTSIAYGNNIFLAIDQYSRETIYSSDGINWQEGAGLPDSHQNWNRVWFYDNKFWAVAYNTTIAAYTSNGLSWTTINLPESKNWQSLAYGNNKLVISCYFDNNSTYNIIYSDDMGQTWNTINIPFTLGTYGQSIELSFGDGKFLALSKTEAAYSTDAVNWTIVNLPNVDTGVWRTAYGNNTFVYVDVNGQYAGGYASVSSGLSCYTSTASPSTSDTVYSAPNTTSALTITSVGTGTITLSDTNTYNYNASGNQTTSQTVGEAHPDWICMIEGVGIKKGNTMIASIAPTVDQTYNAASTNAQSGVAVASGIADSLGTINTQLESIIAQGD